MKIVFKNKLKLKNDYSSILNFFIFLVNKVPLI